MNDAGMIDAHLEFAIKGVAGQLKGNPSNDLKGVEDGDNVALVEIDFDQVLGPASDGQPYGALKVILPKVVLNLQNGPFQASGGYEFDRQPESVRTQKAGFRHRHNAGRGREFRGQSGQAWRRPPTASAMHPANAGGAQSMMLWQLCIGAAFGGAALKGDIDADIDLFDYPTILGAMLLLGDDIAALPQRSELHRTMVIIATIIPIPVPLFYRELAIISHGIEDMRVEMSASFPEPTFGFVKGLKLFPRAYELFTDEDVFFDNVSLPLDLSPLPREAASGLEPMSLTFSAGPLCAQLPRYIKRNGKQVTFGYRLLDTVKLTKVLLNGGTRSTKRTRRP